MTEDEVPGATGPGRHRRSRAAALFTVLAIVVGPACPAASACALRDPNCGDPTIPWLGQVMVAVGIAVVALFSIALGLRPESKLKRAAWRALEKWNRGRPSSRPPRDSS